MKKIILIVALFLFTGMSGLLAQHFQINPIPSYNYQLTALSTGFQELLSHSTPAREKRDMDVVISSSSTSPIPIFATVWVVKENGVIILGPYTIFLDELLSVPIDNGQWGVVVRCDWDVNVSVWID